MRPLVVCCLLSLAVLARAEANEPLRRETVTNRLALAQIAREAGDAALAAALATPEIRDQAVVAVRAAVDASAPERLVPMLVELARSRDPALAPEAAVSLLSVFGRLTARELSAREVLLGDVRSACAAFDKGADKPAPRADIALMLVQAKARCLLLTKSSAGS